MAKKIILSTVFGLLVLVLVFGLVQGLRVEYRALYPVGEPFYGDLEISVEYSRRDNEVYVTLTNLSDETLYSPSFVLARLQNGEMQFRSHVTTSSATGGNVTELAPGGTLERTLSGEYWVKRLKQGQYRVMLSFSLDAENQARRYAFYDFQIK